MKHIFFSFLILTLLPLSASAQGSARFEISEHAPVVAGERVQITISLDPSGSSVDTARMYLDFDADLLRAEGVDLIGDLYRAAPGNAIDQKNGLISWGGFTTDEPITQTQPFARVTLLTKQAGSSEIRIVDQSRIISDGEEVSIEGMHDRQALIINDAADGPAQEDASDPSEQSDSEPRGDHDIEASKEDSIPLSIDCSSHPEEERWYAESEITCELQAFEPVHNVRTVFSKDPSARPDQPHATDMDLTFTAEEDGVHYLRVVAEGTDVRTRRIQIDTADPNPVTLSVAQDQLLAGEPLELTFATTDETSGVAQYQLAINDGSFEPTQTPRTIEHLDPGTYFIRVAALDRAGNATYDSASVRVYPEGTELDRPVGFAEEIGADEADQDGWIWRALTSPWGIAGLILVVSCGFAIILLISRKDFARKSKN